MQALRLLFSTSHFFQYFYLKILKKLVVINTTSDWEAYLDGTHNMVFIGKI